MISLDLLRYKDSLRSRHSEQGAQLFDPIRKKWLSLQPEELVRQLFIEYCIQTNICSRGAISVEKQIQVNNLKRRYDLVIFNNTSPWMLVECKAPDVSLDESTFLQAAQYNIKLQVPYLTITNGLAAHVIAIDFETGSVKQLNKFPQLPNSDKR